MKNENKGRDIFYGVVAIATLIVAIVGATLAYFSISVSSNEGAVNAQSAIVSISYEDGKQVTAQADELIPASYDIVQQVYEERVKTQVVPEPEEGEETDLKNACLDDNGKQVCSAYRFSITSETDIENVVATINSEMNEFTYLAYMVYDYNAGTWVSLKTDENEHAVYYQPINKCSNAINEETGVADNPCHTISEETKKKEYTSVATNSIFGYTTSSTLSTIDLTAKTAQTYDVVLFINENNTPQNEDQGKGFSGTINVTVTDADRITGYIENQ